jgi:hypothetical protein
VIDTHKISALPFFQAATFLGNFRELTMLAIVFQFDQALPQANDGISSLIFCPVDRLDKCFMGIVGSGEFTASTKCSSFSDKVCLYCTPAFTISSPSFRVIHYKNTR